jgi:hypothetical protein
MPASLRGIQKNDCSLEQEVTVPNSQVKKYDLIEELRLVSLKLFERHYFGARGLKIQLNILQNQYRADLRQCKINITEYEL